MRLVPLTLISIATILLNTGCASLYSIQVKPGEGIDILEFKLSGNPDFTTQYETNLRRVLSTAETEKICTRQESKKTAVIEIIYMCKRDASVYESFTRVFLDSTQPPSDKSSTHSSDEQTASVAGASVSNKQMASTTESNGQPSQAASGTGAETPQLTVRSLAITGCGPKHCKFDGGTPCQPVDNGGYPACWHTGFINTPGHICK